MGSAIHCPKCGCEFEVSALVRAQVEGEVRAAVQADFDRRLGAAEAVSNTLLREKDQEVEAARAKVEAAAEKEADILKRERELASRSREVALDVERRVADETKQIREQETRAARDRFAREADERVRQKDEQLEEALGKLAGAATKEAELLRKARELEGRQRELDLDVERRVADEAKKIRAREAKAAEERFAREAEERVHQKDEQLQEALAKLAGAATKEAELLKKARELEERQRELALDVERRVADEATRIREREAKLTEIEREQQRLREEEQRQQNDALERKVQDLQRQLRQGSQQMQGEAQEVALRDLLEQAFATDGVEDVPKGMNGADLIHRVCADDGRACGAILWESKRTRAWSDEWLRKVRDDQRAAGAECAVIVSQVLPQNVGHFALVEGVWVCGWSYATALGTALRLGLVDVAHAKLVAEGRGDKMQMLFDYLTGTEFRLRVEGFVEAFRDMQEDLESEKRAMLTRWSRRARLMQRARDNITAFYGDLQGIAGRQLQDLPALSLEPSRALPGHVDEDDCDDAVARPGDAELKEVLLGLLPDDGAGAGNGSLTEKFIERTLLELGVLATPDDYARCKAALLSEGRIRKGKGKGGSVCRAAAAGVA